MRLYASDLRCEARLSHAGSSWAKIMYVFFKRVYPDQQMAPLRRCCLFLAAAFRGWGGVGASRGPPRVKVRRGVEDAVQQGVNNSLRIAEERLRARCPLCTRTGLGRTAACDWPVPRQAKRITGASQVVRLCCGGGGWGRWREGAVLRDFKVLFLALTHVSPVRR